MAQFRVSAYWTFVPKSSYFNPTCFLNNFYVQCPWTSRGCCPGDLNGQNWEGGQVKHSPGLWIQSELNGSHEQSGSLKMR